MDLVVRPALPLDPCVPLLFESAKPYYTAYAGSEQRALKLLHTVFARPGHAASYEFCRVALLNNRVVGVVAGFPVRHADRLSRRFVSMTMRRLPPWALPGTFKHLRAAENVSPHPRRGPGRGRSSPCAPPRTSPRTRRWTPSTSMRSPSTPGTAARASRR